MRNAIVDQILMERMNRRGGYDGRDYARGDYGRGGYDGRRGRDYGRDYARGGRDGRDGNYDEERFEDEDEKYLMEITMKNALKMRMRNTSWKCKMVDVE